VPQTLTTTLAAEHDSDARLDVSLATAIAGTVAGRQISRFAAYPDYGLDCMTTPANPTILARIRRPPPLLSIWQSRGR
jgi:hypothetical protein